VGQIDIADPKEESFTAINPNGRLPAIKDPNTDMLLWESGAIMEYLVETYDKEGKLKGANSKENYLAKQYLFFQMSGQVSH
jgi:glutathione S-transferase